MEETKKIVERIKEINNEVKKMNELEYTNERQDSIKIGRTSTGKYTWEIKLYYNEDTIPKYPEVITKIREINKSLEESFASSEGIKPTKGDTK